MASGQAFSMLEVDGGPEVWVSELDIADAFNALELPECLRELFGQLARRRALR